MLDVHTLGGSVAAEQLGKSLNECDDLRFRRRVLRRLQTFYKNLKGMADIQDHAVRENAMWSYYRVTLSALWSEALFNATETDLVSAFDKHAISFSLYESVLKTGVRKALRDSQA